MEKYISAFLNRGNPSPEESILIEELFHEVQDISSRGEDIELALLRLREMPSDVDTGSAILVMSEGLTDYVVGTEPSFLWAWYTDNPRERNHWATEGLHYVRKDIDEVLRVGMNLYWEMLLSVLWEKCTDVKPHVDGDPTRTTVT